MCKPWYSKTVSYLFGTWVQIHSICLCRCTAVCRFQQVNVPSCSENNAKNLLRSHFHYRRRLVLKLEGKDSLRFKNMRLGDVSVAFVSVQKQTTAHTLMDFPIYCMSNPSLTTEINDKEQVTERATVMLMETEIVKNMFNPPSMDTLRNENNFLREPWA